MTIIYHIQGQTFTDNLKCVIFNPVLSIKRRIRTLFLLYGLKNFPIHAAFIRTHLRRTFVVHKTISVVGLIAMIIHILHRLYIFKSFQILKVWVIYAHAKIWTIERILTMSLHRPLISIYTCHLWRPLLHLNPLCNPSCFLYTGRPS